MVACSCPGGTVAVDSLRTADSGTSGELFAQREE